MGAIQAVNITAEAQVPNYPANLAATGGTQEVTVSWDAPNTISNVPYYPPSSSDGSPDGGSPITGYNVYYSTVDWAPWTLAGTTDASTTSFDVTGLANDTEYYFYVTAENAVGEGQVPYPTVSAMTFDVPGAVATFDVHSGSGGQDIKVSWTPPATDGGTPVTDYVIYWGTDIYSWTSSATVDASTLSYDVSGLTEGQPYFFSVAAVNAAGSGPLFTPALGATPVTVPSAPQNLAASPSDSAVTLTWHAPADDGGTAILYYDLSSDGGQSWTASATADTMNYTFTGLTNGSSYDLAVRAVNAQGPSAAAPISATPLSVPSMVQNFVAQPDPPTSFDLSWAAPASDGGSAITGYVISWSDDGGSTWSAPVNLDASTTSYTATGLTDGVDYTFQISATNALGSSPVAQSSATDATAPGAVQALTATPADSSVALTWQTPADDGGSPILYYDISTDGGLSWTATTTATNYTATGLTNGTSYDLSVRAENAVEAGLISTVTTTPATVPSRVMSAIWWDSDYTLTPHWTPPADGGSPILYYTVDVKTEAGVEVAGSPYTIPSTGDTTYILPITPLNNGQFYEVNITATNAMGTSLPADYTVQCIGNAPEPLSATATVISANQVTLTWVPGVNTSGVGIIGYYYQESSDGGITWGNTVSAGGSTATTDTITVPTGQELIFKVGSRNSATYSAAALTNSVFIAVPPTAPTGVTATVGPDAGAVTVDWTALTTNFGSPLTDYTVYWSTDGSSWDASQTVPSTATSDEITGLTPGQEYYFAVTASNALGEGVQSTPAVTATTLATAAQPTGLSGTLGNNQVALTWNAPASDGGSTITGYDVYMSTDGTNYSLVPASQLSQPSASSPSATVTGLTNGTPYYFQVVPVTAAGEGASSDPISVTPAAVASSVSSFEATATSPTSMDLSWTAPTDNGAAITSYTITYSSDGGLTFSAPVTVAAPATSTSLTGLTPGANYIIGIVAQNAAGGSVASTVNASTWATPAVPANFSALSGDGQVTLNWQPPTDSGGTPITGYEVSDDGGVTWIDIPSAEATSYTFTGLTNGTSYNFVMRALNAAGTGAESTLSAAPSATPSAPGNVGNLTVTPGDGDATINWSNPSDTGGSAITGYVITWEPGSGQTTVTAPTNTYTIPGLNNGTDYTITISPINNTGVGDSTTIGVTPQTSYSVLADYGTWTGTGTAFAEVDGPISDFIRLETAAGVVVPATNYVVTEGSTITTFSIAYLNTLANGTYHYKMIFSGGASDLLTLIIARPASGGGGGSNTGNGGAGGGNSRNANNTNNGTNNGSNGGSGSNSGSGSNNGSINTGNNTHRTATRQPAQHPSRMPKTGDDLFNYLPFMLMSLVILAITAESIRRTKKRNELEPLPDDSE
ncbi:MAG: fibronectin type III domain-containing protein [Coriobacteriia bacterium]|nr:fibronectin type III domain-containing protein [Coriobacteriia bacterium]MCL2536964.1 fibronectin type III domain-containing protein [Coriobacteriia bacterium]